jgi:hypothetical protein
MPPKPSIAGRLDNIQGDIWSKGFPKYYETYYFFSIKTPPPNEKNLFSQCLKNLATQSPRLISTLRMVREDHNRISTRRKEEAIKQSIPEKRVVLPEIPMSNALIAFTIKGLQAVNYPIRASITKC